MAYATTQSIDQLLTRGLAFRLPNNAPISSLYTLYANGAGMTYWSNSMNPRDLSTLSSAIGELASTVSFQQGEINDLYGQVSTLSTSLVITSNSLVDYFASTITGISTFSTFYNDLGVLSNVMQAGFSTLSTAISVGDSTVTAFLTSTLTSSMRGLVLSSSTGLYNYTNRVSSVTVTYPVFYSTVNSLNRITLSTSTGLNNALNRTNSALSTNISTLRVAVNSTNTNFFSTISGYGPRIGRLETASTGISTTTNRFISTQLGISQSTQDSFYTARIGQLSSYVSTIAVFATAQFGSLSTFSSVLYASIEANNSTNATQNAQISTLARNLSILTTSSILAGVYDTFVQLEDYTVGLINSTVAAMYFWQSSLFNSTIIQNQAISEVFFSTYTGTIYQSTVSAVTALTNAFVSTYTSTAVNVLYSSIATNINNTNSTTIGTLYSTGYVYLLSTLSQGTNPLNSTVVYIGSNAAAVNQANFAVAIGNRAGSNSQSLNAIAVGNNAGSSSQGSSAIAIGLNAGATNQTSGSVAIGSNAGNSGQLSDAVAIGRLAGQATQSDYAIAIGCNAGNANQLLGAVAIGGGAGVTNQQIQAVAVGFEAGSNLQSTFAVAIGAFAGRVNQGRESVAIGPNAGRDFQNRDAVSIGPNAGFSAQGENAIAIGYNAGFSGQGTYAIALGFGAGSNSQNANSIAINATATPLNTTNANATFIDPIRNDATVTGGFLHYNTVTKEVVYNSVGGSGGGSQSSFSDIYFSTSRGLAVTGVNVYGAETARIVDYYMPDFMKNIKLVSTINDFSEGAWSQSLSCSADGRYVILGAGNTNIDAAWLYRSADYGATFNQLTGAGQSNWNGTAMSRSGQLLYIATGGSDPSPGGLLKSTDYGLTFSLLAGTQSIDPIWGTVACSGDGKIVFASPRAPSGDPTSRLTYMSYDYGNTFTTTGELIYAATPSMSITGQYIAVADPISGSLLRVSQNYGRTWFTPSGILSLCECVTVSASGQYMYAGGFGVFFVSSDFGQTFVDVYATGHNTSQITQIACDDSGQYIVAADYNTFVATDGGFMYSVDFGSTWYAMFETTDAFTATISKNAQYMTFGARTGRIYRSFVPTYFPGGVLTTSTVATTARFNTMNVSTIGGFSPITFTDTVVMQRSTVTSNLFVTGAFVTTGSNQSSRITASSMTASSIMIGTTAPVTQLQINPKVIDDQFFNYSNAPFMAVVNKPTSDIVLNDPQPVAHFARQGAAGAAYGARATLALSRYENPLIPNQTSSRTRLDFQLAHSSFDTVNVMTMRSDRRVGIGSSNPGYSLDVEGDARVSSFFYNQRLQTDALFPTGIYHVINGYNSAGTLWGSNAWWSGRTTGGGALASTMQLFTYAGGTTCNSLTISPIGNVGIATRETVPAYKLHINGNMGVQSTIFFIGGTDPGDFMCKEYGPGDRYGIGQYLGGTVRMFGASTFAAATVNFSFARNPDRTGNGLYFDALTAYTTGRIGIRAAPGASTLAGGVNIDSLGINSGRLAYDPAGIASLGFGGVAGEYARIYGQDVGVSPGPFLGDLVFQMRSSGTSGAGLYERMRIKWNGNVGINCNAPTVALDVNGRANITANVPTTTLFLNNPSLTGPTVTGGGAYNSILGLGGVTTANGSNRSWDIGIETTNGSNRFLGFCSYDTTTFTGTRTIRGFINTSVTNVQMNFTGQHRCFPADNSLFPLSSNIGKILIANGQYQSMPTDGALVRGISSITIAESLPLVSLARRAKDKQCFGVICDAEDFNSREFNAGNFGTPYTKIEGDTRIFVNSIGEGAVWVCEANGPIENGDFITTSDVPGYGMKQGEEYIANYTVAKATMSCDFTSAMVPQQVPLMSTIAGVPTPVLDNYSTIIWTVSGEFEPAYKMRYVAADGADLTRAEYDAAIAAGDVAYRAAFIGCTYHCG